MPHFCLLVVPASFCVFAAAGTYLGAVKAGRTSRACYAGPVQAPTTVDLGRSRQKGKNITNLTSTDETTARLPTPRTTTTRPRNV
ncbi:hypothetical protein SPBR_01159 [Sporothrix brasiliensis 5110]|uniref:Secreted protein n=1 Tax=Sporothrix brasiliensis 5110 TaxID=1398154 RepID=A0A0C2EWC0_9PEZI|nr:uncharacterized protein SPBR_01159 [Sporothrix brasiliensis 5110]KIH90874.1 hypothetical protein SPBR_01159 [Sporothrix brasiliensis 5110]